MWCGVHVNRKDIRRGSCVEVVRLFSCLSSYFFFLFALRFCLFAGFCFLCVCFSFLLLLVYTRLLPSALDPSTFFCVSSSSFVSSASASVVSCCSSSSSSSSFSFSFSFSSSSSSSAAAAVVDEDDEDVAFLHALFSSFHFDFVYCAAAAEEKEEQEEEKAKTEQEQEQEQENTHQHARTTSASSSSSSSCHKGRHDVPALVSSICTHAHIPCYWQPHIKK